MMFLLSIVHVLVVVLEQVCCGLVPVVTVRCTSCKEGPTPTFTGVEGEDMTVTYIIPRRHFYMLKLHYNGTGNSMRINQHFVGVDRVDGRLQLINRTVTEQSVVISVALTDLSMDDDGLKLAYDNISPTMVETNGDNVVRVVRSFSSSSTSSFNGFIVRFMLGIFCVFGFGW